jgi:endonuclease/exonuclease/phosphatase family metal-dependent hydrolase
VVVSRILEQGGREPGSFRLLIQNIFSLNADWERRRTVLSAGIAALEPDVVLLQESFVTPDHDYTTDILGDGWETVHATTRASDGGGISIASRWPIVDVHELDLKDVSERTFDFACTTLMAEVHAPEPFGTMVIVNHFPDYHTTHEVERERQTVIAARSVEARLDRGFAHVLLGGDLDAEPDAASLRFLAGKQSLEGMSVCYQNAWDACHPGEPGHTFTPDNPLAPRMWPFRRIDHILIRCGDDDMPTLEIAACELAFNQPVGEVWGSDHFGLVADFRPRAT